MALEPNHVYVIPSHADMALEHGVLRLFPRPQARGMRFAIDAFFFSLAHERGPYAIGVVLSGMASDGTAGLQEIKVEGGFTFAQDEHTAAFPQMPQHAIAAGCVDHVLPPQEIAQELARLRISPAIVSHPVSPRKLVPVEQEEQALTALLLALSQYTGVDFLAYKQATLIRHILRRMAVLHLDSLVAYATYACEHLPEIRTLYQEVLIPVTSFFRDEAAFAALKRLAFPDIVRQIVPGATIRIWVPGCSTGEEAYSLVICLLEFLEEQHLSLPIQLFATDINPSVLTRARTGIYPANVLSIISPERLARFFDPLDTEQGSYRIARAVRERCVFALHNAIKDPPFTHLDLVSCHNVLIYLGADSQEQMLRIFHYALKPEGFLLLVASESVNPFDRLFAAIECRQKLYCKKEGAVSIPQFGEATARKEISMSSFSEEHPRVWRTPMQNSDIQQEVDRLLLANYVPAGVVIDTTMDILQVRGHTAFYLELAPGKAGINLLKMAREGLGPSLRSSIATARKSNRLVTKEPVQVTAFGTTRDIRITVLPLKEPSAGHYFLVLFEELTPARPASPPSRHASTRSLSARRIATLELEITMLRADMQGALEEYEASKEELQAANKEIHSSNEELQSINEELEASQEELQSTNQELLTTNQALERRNEEVQAARERADAIVETVREPLIVLTREGLVKRANAAFYQFFQLSFPEAEGHHLCDLKNGQCALPGLAPLLERMFLLNEPIYDYEVEHTFPLIGYKVLRLNARRIVDESPGAGDHWVLLAIEDITARKELERQKDSLIGMASHELKTPLTSAKLQLQLLQRHAKKAGDAWSAGQLEQATAHLNRLTRLIDGFLDLAAIEMGHVSMHQETFAIDALVQTICEELQHTNAGQPLAFVQRAQAQVYGDRMHIEEILCNLVTNAIKYAPSEQPIEVRAESQGEWVTISVRDHGKGIPQELQASIFERFYRANEPTHQRQSGTGLGLYLASQLVKQQGGRIWVESTPGEGATFFFTVPRQAASSASENSPSCGET